MVSATEYGRRLTRLDFVELRLPEHGGLNHFVQWCAVPPERSTCVKVCRPFALGRLTGFSGFHAVRHSLSMRTTCAWFTSLATLSVTLSFRLAIVEGEVTNRLKKSICQAWTTLQLLSTLECGWQRLIPVRSGVCRHSMIILLFRMLFNRSFLEQAWIVMSKLQC